MFCKWCGLESETTDVCSWCRKPFSNAAAPASGSTENTPPAPSAPPSRTAPEIDNYDDLPPPAASTPVIAEPTPSPAPAMPAAGGGMPLGDSFDDIDDDLSPFPFGGRGYTAAPLPPRSATPPGPPPPSFAPPAQPPSAPSAAGAPSASPAPAPAAPAVPPAPAARESAPPAGVPAPHAPGAPAGDGRPPMEAIPIRLKTPGAGAPPPPVVPLKPPAGAGGRAPAPYSPVEAGTPSPSAPPPPTFRPTAAPPPAHAPMMNAAPQTPPASAAPSGPPAAKPLTPDSLMPAEPLAARGPMPLGGPSEEEGPIDLGLKPLAPAEDEEVAPIAVPGGRRLDLGGAPAAPPSRPATVPVAPPPARGNVPTLSQAIGRTWYCKWCGMNSEDPNTCSWCRRDLRAAPAATGKPAHVTVTHGPARGKPVRQPVAKQKVKTSDKKRSEPLPDLLKDAPKSPAAQNGTGLPKAAPQIGTFQAAKSKYYSDQVIDPVSGAHYDADTGSTTDTPVEVRETVETNDWVQLGIYSGVFAVLLILVYVVGTSVIRGSVAGYFAVLAISSFAAGILLPVLRVAPWPKDDSEDVGWAMGLIPLFGPFAGTMGYGVLGVVRQDVNPAILGVFITSLLLRVVLDLATGHALDRMVPFRELSGLVLGAQLMPFVTLAGWYSSEMFHKPDE